MSDYPIVNKKMVRLNRKLKKNQKEYRKEYDTGSRRMSGNRIGKLVKLSAENPLKDCSEPETYCEMGPDAEVLIHMVEQSGLKGMSGNGFLTANKLKTFWQAQQKKRVLIVNAVECDPGLVHDEWILKEKASAVWMGIEYLNQAFHFETVMVAVKGKNKKFLKAEQGRIRDRSSEGRRDENRSIETRSDKTQSDKSRRDESRGAESRSLESKGDGWSVKVKEVAGRYPMGEEHFLIKELLGIPMDKSEIPAKSGILVMNVQTVFQICRLVNKLDTDARFVTLANLKTGEARVAYVTSEDRIHTLLEAIYPGKGTYYAGHGVLGAHKAAKDETFAETINFAAVGEDTLISDQNLCKKCGGCSRRCPMGISVKDIVLAREKNEKADISRFHPEQCIHCGSCTFFCHASKNVEKIVQGEEC